MLVLSRALRGSGDRAAVHRRLRLAVRPLAVTHGLHHCVQHLQPVLLLQPALLLQQLILDALLLVQRRKGARRGILLRRGNDMRLRCRQGRQKLLEPLPELLGAGHVLVGYLPGARRHRCGAIGQGPRVPGLAQEKPAHWRGESKQPSIADVLRKPPPRRQLLLHPRRLIQAPDGLEYGVELQCESCRSCVADTSQDPLPRAAELQHVPPELGLQPWHRPPFEAVAEGVH
mmetsp:Transcript_36740/g.77095  ORF Transcript_36740/g.77095 Transcript_36740/m.77095 type:complete len:230 (-) Transcript_36740:121-810(-)